LIAATLIRTALDAGVELRLVDGQLKVSGRRKAVELWAPTLRQHKADLICWFGQPAANEPEPPSDPGAWHELAAAYYAHHFKCPTCQAAGRGARYGLRCGTGAALWSAYTMPGKVAL